MDAGDKVMNKNNINEESYVGINAAAEFLGIKTVTLRKWLKSKPNLPSHRVGKLWKFKISELDEWISSGKSAEN
jgi:excisionase family DNA binding protein